MNNSLNNIHKCFEENAFKPRCKNCKQQFLPICSRQGLYQRFCRDTKCIKERHKVIRRKYLEKLKMEIKSV